MLWPPPHGPTSTFRSQASRAQVRLLTVPRKSNSGGRRAGAAGCEGRREAGNRAPCLRVGKSWPSSSRHPAQPKSHRGSQAFRQFLPSPSSAPGPFSVLPYRLVLSVHSPPEGPRCPGNPRGHGQGKSAPKQSPFIFVASSFVTFNWKQVSNTQARVLAGNAPQSI